MSAIFEFLGEIFIEVFAKGIVKLIGKFFQLTGFLLLKIIPTTKKPAENLTEKEKQKERNFAGWIGFLFYVGLISALILKGTATN